MRVYQVRCDVNQFQSFDVDTDNWDGDILSLLTFDCVERAAAWSAPPVFVLHPRKKKGNCFAFAPGAFAIDQTAFEQLADLLEMSGELLPLQHQGETYYVVNVLECVNCLDEDNTQWIYGNTTGVKIGIRSHVFYRTRFTETPLFKIPATSKAQILTVEGLADPEGEFKGRVEQCGITGLEFDLLWSDEQ